MKDTAQNGLRAGDDGRRRCWWPGADETYTRYHDQEWGFPVGDDQRLFEKICLEGFQSGLSWITILRKREAFRRAFDGFAFERVARFGARDVRRLLGDAAIVRHRGKIEATITNAKAAVALRDECGSLASYFWRWAPDRRPKRLSLAEMRARTTTPESIALSRDLKRRGWAFVGPTTIYSFMQAMGLVNDHLTGCAVRDEVEEAVGRFRRPS